MSMGLSLGLGLGIGSNHSTPPASVPDLICGAIHSRHEISATHKGNAFVLSPHIVYWKAGQPDVFWLDAVVVSENGNPASKPKLDGFKLTDLAGLSVLEAVFEPHVGFKSDSPQYTGKTRCVL